jgi:hypothetical protein
LDRGWEKERLAIDSPMRLKMSHWLPRMGLSGKRQTGDPAETGTGAKTVSPRNERSWVEVGLGVKVTVGLKVGVKLWVGVGLKVAVKVGVGVKLSVGVKVEVGVQVFPGKPHGVSVWVGVKV